ncbi:MAG TPA: AraC family transcriptional regulator [Cyclobacteriaceae bacterium]|nr:AraC family transcriptional regulator [Cyclobacteriaceae bacterium]
MKPHFHKVPITQETSFSIRHDIVPNFGTLWHYHPELELHYTIKGEGVKFIGDNVSNFSGGDMILLGENLPHTWHCRESYFQAGSDLEAEALVLHFHPHCLGKDFMHLPEAYLLPHLFEQAKKGLTIGGESKSKIADLLYRMLEAKNLERLLLFLSILDVLIKSENLETIASAYAFHHPTNAKERERLERVFAYVLSNYRREITLEEVASLAHMSVTSFCRYFKGMTHKTFSGFLIEVRVSHVCRALIENKLPTEVICFECGFNNVSNFYRQFKKVTGMTPFEYKKKYLLGYNLRAMKNQA